MSSNCLYDKMFLQELNLHSPSKFKMHAEIDSPFSVRAFSFKKITLKSFRAFSFLEFCQIFHRGHFPLYDGHFLLGHFPFRAFSVLPKMALFHPKYAHSFLAAAACSLNRSPFSISSLNHHSSLSKGPKLYACQSGPLSKDEVDDWHRMKCHLGILTRSWESECTMYLGQGICIK